MEKYITNVELNTKYHTSITRTVFLITEDGKVYKTEEEDGLFSGEPFLMIPLEEEYSKISLYNESCDLKLIGLNKNNEVKDLLVNE